jgi:hypothetical protein
VTGDWRKLHNEALHNLHSFPNIIRAIKSMSIGCPGHAACIVGMRNAYKILVGKSEGKKSLGRREEDNTKMDLKEIECDDEDWNCVAQDWVQWQAFVNTVMNLQIPQKVEHFFTI